MVQVIQPRPRQERPSFMQSLLGGAGQALPGAVNAHMANQLKSHQAEQEHSRELEKLSHQSDLKQKESVAKLRGDTEVELRDFETVKNTFGDKFAKLYQSAPVGGKTQLIQFGIEALHRGLDLDQLLGNISPDVTEEIPDQPGFQFDQNEPISDSEMNNEPSTLNVPENTESTPRKVKSELNNYLKNQDIDLTPAERVARGKERFSSGLPIYQEAGEKLRAFARDKERLDILDDLDKSEKLPKNMGRINVDTEGKLVAPFLASPEAQRFVKTLNEFSSSAKDTFGSRVTNFDLAQYMQRFPTLLNTSEGRRQILQQMKIVNQINSVYYKNLKDVYDQAGGVRNIDADVAERYAEKLSEKEVSKLSNKFKEIGQFESKPSASEFKGRKIKDKKTGEILISNGEDWIPFEGEK